MHPPILLLISTDPHAERCSNKPSTTDHANIFPLQRPKRVCAS